MMAKYIQYVSTGNLLGATILVSNFIISDDNGTLNNLYYIFDARKFAAMHYGKKGGYGEIKFNHNKLQITNEYSDWIDPLGFAYTDLYKLIDAVAADVAAFIP